MTPKKILFLDGCGAAASALSSAVVLPLFAAQLGLAPSLLRVMAAAALLFMIWSWSCRFLFQEARPWMLKGIIAANLSYCIVTAGIMFLNEDVTWLGQLVLAGEIVIVFTVVAIETKVLRAM